MLQDKNAARIVVEVMPLTFQEELADMLAEFSGSNPDIQMRIIERENQESLARLRRGEIDLAIMRYEGEEEHLRVIPILSNKMILAVAGRRASSPSARPRRCTKSAWSCWPPMGCPPSARALSCGSTP